jgi:hypothetical protein
MNKMKTGKSIWLPSALLLGIVALITLIYSGFMVFSVFRFKWSRIFEQFIWGLSEPIFRQLVVIPAALAVIMLIRMIINIKVAGDRIKENILFLVLLTAVAISILFKYFGGGWCAISVILAWRLQRHESNKLHNKAFNPDAG